MAETKVGKRNFMTDMTSGNITKLLITFALPLLVGNVFQQLYNMVDSVIVGRYVGPIALGAVGSVGSVNFLLFSLCFGLSNGVGILISQIFGAKDYARLKRYIANAFYVTFIVGIVTTILAEILSKPILRFMNTPPENFEYALAYMRIICAGVLFVGFYNTISAILRALGDSKTPLIFLIVSSVLNVVLDLLFIVVFNMATAGAALATIVSQLASAVGVYIFGTHINPYLQLKKSDMVFDLSVVGKLFRIGLPLAVQNGMIAVSSTILQRVVNSYGSVVMAAYTATGRIEQLVHQPYGSLCAALSTFAGQNYGAANKERVVKGCKKGIKMIIFFSIFMVLVMNLFASNIVSLFTADAEVISVGAKGLIMTSYMYFFLGLIYVMRGLLNGVGDVTFSMMSGIFEIISRLLFVNLMTMIPAAGVWGVWYTNGLTWGVVGIMSVLRFVYGSWKKKI